MACNQCRSQSHDPQADVKNTELLISSLEAHDQKCSIYVQKVSTYKKKC